MGYEEFTGKKRLQGDFPMISIFKQGVLSVNKACYEKYLKKYSFVVLLFDETNQKIGIRPTNEATGKSFPIRSDKFFKHCFISARGFLNHYQILPTHTKAYACSWNVKENILEIDLKEK